MKTKIGLLIVVLLVLLGVLVLNQVKPTVPAGEDLAAAYDIDKSLTYGFQVTNPSNHLIKTVEFWAYAPVKRTGHQFVKVVSANVPMRLKADRLGNQRMIFTLNNLPPYGQQMVDVTVQLGMSVLPVALPEDVKASHYLAAQPFMEVDQPDIQRVAEDLSAGKEDTSAVFNWVHKQIKNPGYIAQDRGALYALQSGEGDCSEHMYLLATLLRATGTPARGIAGFVAAESARLTASELHNWAEYYDGKNWVGMDSDRGLASIPPTSYVAMRILDTDSDDFGDGSQASFGAPPAITVMMN